eukprot:scaffold4311_cov177-Amphora_coffeaeformis.AAC.6
MGRFRSYSSVNLGARLVRTKPRAAYYYAKSGQARAKEWRHDIRSWVCHLGLYKTEKQKTG